MTHFIAVDAGGTQLRAACYPQDSHIPEQRERISTRHPSSTPLERLMDLIASVWPKDQTVSGIGVAVPGVLDPYEGLLFEAPNIPGWEQLPLRRLLVERFQAPVALGNDANLAALGEWKFGAGRGHHHLVYMTVSTGIGGGVIIDDRLLLGVTGLAAELGHVTVVPDGPLCGCGQRGHLEAVASGPAIARWAEEQVRQGAQTILPAGGRLTAKLIGEAACNGDALSIEALARAGRFIGETIANYLHIFNPSAVIIGGGVSQCGPFLLDPIRTAMNERVLSSQYLKNLTLTTAALGDDAGLMGALALAHTLIR